MLLDLLDTIEKIQKRIPVKTVVMFTNSYEGDDCWGICLTIEAYIKNETVSQKHFFSKWEIQSANKEAEDHKIKMLCKQFLQSYRSYANA